MPKNKRNKTGIADSVKLISSFDQSEEEGKGTEEGLCRKNTSCRRQIRKQLRLPLLQHDH